jgi:hypothetical protein
LFSLQKISVLLFILFNPSQASVFHHSHPSLDF